MNGNGADLRPKTLKQLKKHVKTLANRRWGKNSEFDGFDDEFNYIEQQGEGDFYFEDFSGARALPNRSKNRYSNVLALESTRVKLPDFSPDSDTATDYINANYITGCSLEDHHGRKLYIAGQGPLKETVTDFWKMVWAENTNMIVMLTKITEGDRQKCNRYWSKSSRTKHIGKLFTVTTIDPPEFDTEELVVRRMTLTHHGGGSSDSASSSANNSRELLHFQYREWPDHGLPKNTETFRQLLRLVDEQPRTGPIVVHCSAGIGRTGTFCTVHINLSKLKYASATNPPTFDILGTVLRLRKERLGMVQTKEQYMFCYLAVLEGVLEWKAIQKKKHQKSSSRASSSSTTPSVHLAPPNQHQDNASSSSSSSRKHRSSKRRKRRSKSRGPPRSQLKKKSNGATSE